MPGRVFHADPPFAPSQGAPAAPPPVSQPRPPGAPVPQPRPAGAPVPQAPRPAGVPVPQVPRPAVGPGGSGQFTPPGPQPVRAEGGAAPAVPPVPPLAGAPVRTDAGSPKIRALDQKLGAVRHEDSWQRSPNVTGTGAIHVKSFHCKLTGDALENIDRQINEWLDAHPQYEVKFVSSTVGEWTGKLKEPNLILQLWV